MANPVSDLLLTENELIAPGNNPEASAGAVVDFFGVVRRLEEGREIDGIEYEAHRPMAEHQLQVLAQQAIEKFTLRLIVVHHRLGFVAAGETSLFARVASRNRAEAFQASQWLIDELKRRLPIWKRPKFKIDHQQTIVDSSPRADLIPQG